MAKKDPELKTKTIINNSGKSFLTSKGDLTPGRSQELPEAEANALLDYIGVVDAATVVPASVAKTDEALKSERDSLVVANKELQGQIEKLAENNKMLLEDNGAKDEEIKTLKNSVEGLQKMLKELEKPQG